MVVLYVKIVEPLWNPSNSFLQPASGAVYTPPPPPNLNQQNYFARNHKPNGLPPPHELAQRIEEARTSSKLLLQVVQSTPPAELIGNELVKEFVERCQSASRSIQGYIHSNNPPPDEDTLLTLIETNDQISTSISRHQRALLQARRVTGAASVAATSSAPTGGLFEAPGSQPRGVPTTNSFSPPSEPPSWRKNQLQSQDPFSDRHESDMSRPDTMQAPLEPQHYDVSASTRQQQNGTHASTSYHTNFQPMSPYDGHTNFQPMSPYDGQHDYAVNHQTVHGATAPSQPVSPEEVRRPVQYRF